MPKVRAYGADATLKACREASYGVAPLTGYRSLDFKSTDLSSAQPLGDDPLLGRSRNAQDPYRGLITDEGQIDILPLFEAFQLRYVSKGLLLDEEKNGSAPLPSGISAGATSIADPAMSAQDAPAANAHPS